MLIMSSSVTHLDFSDSAGLAYSAVFPGYAVPIGGIIVDNNLNFANSSDIVQKSLDVSDDIIYRRAYVSYDGQAWTQFNLTPTSTLSGEWIYGRGISNIVFSPAVLHLNSSRNFSNNTYIIIYSCSKNVTIHNWSCHDGWQIIPFNAKLNTANSRYPSITFVSPTPNSGSTINASSQRIVASISDDSSSISSWIDFDKSLVGYWSMDSYSTTGVFDNSSYKNFGTFSGGMSTNNIVTGVRGKGLSFDGVNGYLSMATQYGLPTGNSYYTLSAWVYPINCASGSACGIVRWGQYSDNHTNAFVITSNSKLMNYWHNNDVTSTGTVSLNTWSHVAVTYDGSNRTFYINGVASGSFASSGLNIITSDFEIGSTAGDENFNGSLDEVMIFNRALSSSEIKALYDSKLNKFDATLNNLANGQHSYTVYAIDGSGSTVNSGQKTFNVNAASTCSVTSYTPALNTFCGSKTVVDNCGNNVVMTGTLPCTPPVTCGGGGTPNICGSPTQAPFCGDTICNNGETCSSCLGDCGTCQSYSRTFYISSSAGNDNTGDGSINNPWKTLDKVNSQIFKPGDGILFKRGDIWYGTLTVSSSGSSTAPITYGAYGSGTNPVISGFTTLTGWTNVGNGIYSKAISAESMPNMVTVDGVNTPLGRTPNLPSIHGWPSSILTGDSYTSTSMTDASLAASPNLNGAEIVMRSSEATNERKTVTQSGHTLTYSSTHDTPPAGAGYFIQNHISTLDVFGEWSYTNGIIYMYFGLNDNPNNNHIIKVSTIDNLIICSKNYITFDDLTIEGANNHGIDIQNSNYDTIHNCIIHYGGAEGIYGNACSYLTITSNNIDNNNDDGIYLETSCTHHTITYNTITNSGMILGMGGEYWNNNEAIWSQGAYGLISHNTINNQGYDGIRWGGQNTEVSYNFINNSCQNAADCGGIYSYRDGTSGRVVKYNIILNSAAQLYGWEYQDKTSANGIYLDGDSNTLITNNILANNQGSGLFINVNQHTTAEYNTFYNNLYGILVYSETNNPYLARSHTVTNNILFANNNAEDCLYLHTESNAADLESFGTIDYNYFAQPMDNDNYIKWTYYDGTNWQGGLTNLAKWKTLYGYDSHSTASSTTLTDVNNILFYYNEQDSNKNIVLPSGTYVDITNKAYSGSLTLTPWTSIILMKKS